MSKFEMAKRWKKSVLISCGAALLVMVSYVGSQAYIHQEVPQKYRIALVDRGDITQSVLASGTLQPLTSVSVGLQASGTVLERLADFNDHVKAGQVLLRLDPTIFEARVRQARAQLESARASLAFAEANQTRNIDLQKQGFISIAATSQTSREFDIAAANVASAKAQLDTVMADLNNTIVRAPISGVIINRKIEVGQTVAASFQTPELFQIAQNLKKMRIHCNVSEADIGQLKVGQSASFTVDAYQDREFYGSIVQFRPTPNNTSGVVTYNILVDVDNSDELLKPGMTSQVRIVTGSRTGVLRVPAAALRFRLNDSDEDRLSEKKTSVAGTASILKESPHNLDPGLSTPSVDKALGKLARVYAMTAGVQKANLPVPKDIQIGITDMRYAEVLSGELKEGDQVVTRTIAIASALQ